MNIFDIEYIIEYVGLFFVAFVSATIIPMGSEVMLVYMANSNEYPILALLLTASIANTLGSCVNYYLGLKGLDFLIKKKYLNTKQVNRSRAIFDKYGIFSLCLSWVPIIGDPITLVAGVLRYNFLYFLAIVFFAKTIRYIVVLGVF